MGIITSTNLAQAITKVVAVQALEALVGNLQMGGLVNRSYDSALANSGDTVTIAVPTPMTVQNLAEGADVTYQNPNLGFAQIVLNKHMAGAFIIPDVTRAIAAPDIRAIYMQESIIAMAEQVERDLFGLYPGFTANAPLGAPSTPLTEALIDQAETRLFSQKVGNRPKFLAVNADTYSVLRQIPRFSEYRTAADAGVQALIEGEVLKAKNLLVFRSQYVAQTGTAPTVATHNIAFTPSALALVTRRMDGAMDGMGVITEYAELGNFAIRVTSGYVQQKLSMQFTVDMLYGTAVLRPEHALEITT